jgi:hypothetical protein
MNASVPKFGGHGVAIVPPQNLQIKNVKFPHLGFSIRLTICRRPSPTIQFGRLVLATIVPSHSCCFEE